MTFHGSWWKFSGKNNKEPDIRAKTGFFATNDKEYLELLYDTVKDKKSKVLMMLLFHTIKDSPSWVIPIITASMIDLTTAPHETRVRMLLIYTAIMMLFVFQNYFTHVIFVKIKSSISRNISLDLRTKLCRQLQQLSLLYHNKANVGRLHSKIIRDMEVVEDSANIMVDGFYGALVDFIVAVVVVYMRAPKALVFFLFLVAISSVLRRIFRTGMRKNSKLLRTSIEDMSASVSNMMVMAPVTRAHGLEEQELNNISKKISDVFKKGINLDVLIAKFSALSWMTFIGSQSLFFAWSVYMAFHGAITVGDVVLFNSFFAQISSSVSMILYMLPRISGIKESLISIAEILNRPDIERNCGKRKIEKVTGNFEFRNVSFAYPSTDLPAVHDISFYIKSGQSVAFVGPSGAGKTTLLFLILGFIRPEKGNIFLDSQDMNDFDLRTFRSNVGVVAQDIVFFSGTIKDNIAYGNYNITDESVIEALKFANAWEFVKELPKGINTFYGEDGIGLSGGQKQRLAIARALIRSPKVLILDEATSNLDMESELLIQESLDKIMKNQTTFIVSHRLSLVRNVDVIVILENGRISATGSHSDLLKFNNQYSRSFNQITM